MPVSNSLLTLAPYAALLGLLFIALSVNVIRNRVRVQAALGDKGDEGLQRAIRAHGNFAEYTPFALLLLSLLAACGAAAWLLHGLAACLCVGRIAHAYSITRHEREKGSIRYRQLGMALSFSCIGISAAYLLILWASTLLTR